MIDRDPHERVADARTRLGGLGVPFLGLVLVEFLLGMALNLFGPLPTGSPGTVLVSSPILVVHLVVGSLLLGIAANALRWASVARLVGPILVAGLGLLSGISAFLAGLSFAFGDPSSAASYAMSVGFAGLLLEAGYLLRLQVGRPATERIAGSPRRGADPEA